MDYEINRATLAIIPIDDKTSKIYEETEEVLIEPIVIKETDFENEEDERIICINTNVIYENNKIAGEQTGISSGAIKRCCNEDTKSAGKDEEGNKLVWKYVKDL